MNETGTKDSVLDDGAKNTAMDTTMSSGSKDPEIDTANDASKGLVMTTAMNEDSAVMNDESEDSVMTDGSKSLAMDVETIEEVPSEQVQSSEQVQAGGSAEEVRAGDSAELTQAVEQVQPTDTVELGGNMEPGNNVDQVGGGETGDSSGSGGEGGTVEASKEEAEVLHAALTMEMVRGGGSMGGFGEDQLMMETSMPMSEEAMQVSDKKLCATRYTCPPNFRLLRIWELCLALQSR